MAITNTKSISFPGAVHGAESAGGVATTAAWRRAVGEVLPSVAVQSASWLLEGTLCEDTVRRQGRLCRY